MPGILIATDDGLLEVIPGEEPERILAGHQVSDVDYRDGLAAAVVPGEGVWVHLSNEWKAIARWRDADGWTQVWEGDARSIRVAPGGELYIGSAPPAVFVLYPGAQEANELGAFRGALRASEGQQNANSSVTPVASGTEVSAVSFPDNGPEETLYVAVEGGGVWCAPDPGANLQFENFEKRSSGLNLDVSGLWVHPERADRLFASTASGFYRSDDSGRTWLQSISGLDRSRAGNVVVIPGAPDALVMGCARREPDLDGALFRSANGGVSWTRIMLEGEDEWEHAPLVAKLWDSPDTLFAVAGDKIWGSHDGGRGWVPLAEDLPRAYALAPAL